MSAVAQWLVVAIVSMCLIVAETSIFCYSVSHLVMVPNV